MRLLHVCPKDQLASIATLGLQPCVGPRSAVSEECQPAVFCFSSLAACEDALMNWLGEAFDEETELLVIELEVADDVRTLESAAGFEVAVIDPISASCIVAVRDESLERLGRNGAQLRTRPRP